jgi:uncharacterized integral membrane protein
MVDPSGRRRTATTREIEMSVETHPSEPLAATEAVEPRAARLRRHRHRTGLYAWAFVLVAVLVIVVALAVANTRQVRVGWVVGTSHAALVWLILASTVLGWLLGIATGIVFRLRTRRRRPAGTTTQV